MCQLVCFIVFISQSHKNNEILILLVLNAIFAPYSFQRQFENAKYSLFESAVCKQKPIPTVLTSKSFMLLLTAMMPLLGNYPPTDVFSVLWLVKPLCYCRRGDAGPLYNVKKLCEYITMSNSVNSPTLISTAELTGKWGSTITISTYRSFLLV